MARKAWSFIAWCGATLGVGVGCVHGLRSDSITDPSATTAAALFVALAILGCFVSRPPMVALLSAVATVAAVAAGLRLEVIDAPTYAQTVGVEVLLMMSQAVLILGLVAVIRKRLGARATEVLADGLIVALGAWVVSWVVLVQPSIASSAGTSLTACRGVALGLAIIVIFLLAVLMFSDTTPSVSVTMFGVAVGLELIGIILRAVALRDTVDISAATVHAPLLMAAVISGAAFVHPSVRSLLTSGARRTTPPLMARLVTTTASLVVPIVVLAITTPDGNQDRLVRTISVAVLAIVAMARVILSVRSNAHTQVELVRTALTDSLTGLPNRVLMSDHISNALESSWGSNRQPTVLFIDVDRFKNINDSLGHSVGDDILTVVAGRLVAAIPPHATVARIAGDEFVVLDPTTQSSTQSVLLAEGILDSFREPVRTSEGDMFVTASIGVAYAPRGLSLTADDLMRHADTAMYRAKDAGRNCIALFDDSMLEKVTRRLDVETALYRALERNELRLVHQPIVDVQLGLVVGFEALMRWDRGEAGVVPPDDFIPVAEETGTIVPLGSWALQDALRQLREWIDSGVCSPSTTMSVNVSPRQLNDPQFVSMVSDALTTTRTEPSQLWLEVTESVMITEPVQALASLRRLNSLGVRIAVDDFGTGYSSLSILQRFPIQCIKIDRAFVNDINNQDGARNIVRTIIAMASAMGADVVAEGIENAGQLEVLKSMQCHRAQGYFIGRPVGTDEIPSLVRRIEDIDSLWRKSSTPS